MNDTNTNNFKNKVNPVQSKTAYLNEYMRKKKGESTAFNGYLKQESEGRKCNHNPKDPDTTLIKSHIRKMVCPNIISYYCSVCKECFQIES